jgi:hypothetical protein
MQTQVVERLQIIVLCAGETNARRFQLKVMVYSKNKDMAKNYKHKTNLKLYEINQRSGYKYKT